MSVGCKSSMSMVCLRRKNSISGDAMHVNPSPAAAWTCRRKIWRGSIKEGWPSGMTTSQNIRAACISGTSCSKGRTWKVDGSGIAILSDSEIREKPSMEDPSKPTPSSKADSSSDGLITTDFNPPMRSVNHNRMKRISRSSTVRRTNSCWLLIVLTLVETTHPR